MSFSKLEAGSIVLTVQNNPTVCVSHDYRKTEFYMLSYYPQKDENGNVISYKREGGEKNPFTSHVNNDGKAIMPEGTRNSGSIKTRQNDEENFRVSSRASIKYPTKPEEQKIVSEFYIWYWDNQLKDHDSKAFKDFEDARERSRQEAEAFESVLENTPKTTDTLSISNEAIMNAINIEVKNNTTKIPEDIINALTEAIKEAAIRVLTEKCYPQLG